MNSQYAGNLLPGSLNSESMREAAMSKAKALALCVLADRFEYGWKIPPDAYASARTHSVQEIEEAPVELSALGDWLHRSIAALAGCTI